MRLSNILLSVMLIANSAVRAAEPSREIIRLTNGEWPPFLGESLKHYGVASHIVEEAFALGGVKVKWGFFPWPRALKIAEDGVEWDGSAVWLHSPEREQAFYLSTPVIMSGYAFFHLKTFKFDWKTIADLKGLLIGGTLEYNYGEAFETAEKNKTISVSRVPTDELNLNMLLHGRIQIFPIDVDVASAMMRKNFKPEESAKFTYHETKLRTDPLMLLLSQKGKQNERLIKVFNQGLETLKSTGKIDQFLADSRAGKYEK